MRSVGTVEARHPRKWMTNSPQSCMKIESYMLRHVEIRTWKIQLFFAFVTRPPTRERHLRLHRLPYPVPHKHRQIKHQHVLVVLTSRIAFKQSNKVLFHTIYSSCLSQRQHQRSLRPKPTCGKVWPWVVLPHHLPSILPIQLYVQSL